MMKVLFTLGVIKMPLQNRVDPKGELHAVSNRGMFMGNKGCLHNEQKQIVKKAGGTTGWVICALNHKGIKRELMAKGKYTELFFLDEATALAAGHRPCNDCLKSKFADFKLRWLEAYNDKNSAITTMAEINKINQKERYYRGNKVTYQDNMLNLPNGTFIEIEQSFYLIWQGAKYLWSFEGYKEKSDIRNELVTILTPQSFVDALAGGYTPEVHPSIRELA